MYNLRCGRCHIVPDVEDLELEEWGGLIVVLDGYMPVFSEEERSSIVRYLQNLQRNRAFKEINMHMVRKEASNLVKPE